VIKMKQQADGDIRVTFAVHDERPVSVVGDFNGWDPHAHPMARRSNGTRSAAVTVAAGTTLRFRYLADGGDFYDDHDADAIADDGMGGTHSVVTAR
jgi:1,4-alpha-glucan branching enzyme